MRFSTTRVIGILALAVGASCSDGPTAPSKLEPGTVSDSSAKLLGLFGPRPLYCPNSAEQSTTAILGPLGGTLSVAGTSVLVPLGALLDPVKITLTIPPSNYAEIDVTVEGTEHFIFQLPITVTVSYAHCSLGLLQRLLPLSVWHWEPSTRKFLERMPSLDNKLTRTITFTTPHLSGYIIAN
jgi:hypothetical protein